MRIKYKTPHNLFWRRFFRVERYEIDETRGLLLAINKGGRELRLPLQGTIVVVIP